MPRITDSSSENHDFCKLCFPNFDNAQAMFDDVEEFGEGPDGRGNCFEYDCVAPTYGSDGWGDYECEHCGKELTDNDN